MNHVNEYKDYRRQIRQEFARYELPFDPDADRDDQIFFDHLTKVFGESESAMASQPLKDRLDPEASIIALRHCSICIGYLTYGKLEAAKGILKSIPLLPLKMRKFVSGEIMYLVSPPRDLDPFAEPETVLRWIEDNEATLSWDEASGRFISSTPTQPSV